MGKGGFRPVTEGATGAMNIVLTPVIKNRLDMLYLHERVSTEVIVGALQTEVARRMVKLFVAPRLSLAQRVEFHQHGVDWTDRLIVGDSRIVMDSVLECDLMAGRVEMIYLDPASDDSKDEDPAREADLAYLRDRLVLCHGLLHESGSTFVRIVDEDLSSVRSVMDEVFGADNCCGIVTLETTSVRASEPLPSFGEDPIGYRDSIGDSLVWYSRNLSQVKYQQLLVLLHFQAQYPTVFGEGSERRRRCGILLR